VSPSLQRARKAALAIGGLLAFLLGFSWLALPGILQTQAQSIVAEKSGHRLTLGKPEINPLALQPAPQRSKARRSRRRNAACLPRTFRGSVGLQPYHSRHRHRTAAA
jgi:hypothetical protein